MARYNTAEEITKAFIKKGWNKDTTFTVLTDDGGNTGLRRKMDKGRKFFVMNVTGNIFEDNGKVAVYNIPNIMDKEHQEA